MGRWVPAKGEASQVGLEGQGGSCGLSLGGTGEPQQVRSRRWSGLCFGVSSLAALHGRLEGAGAGTQGAEGTIQSRMRTPEMERKGSRQGCVGVRVTRPLAPGPPCPFPGDAHRPRAAPGFWRAPHPRRRHSPPPCSRRSRSGPAGPPPGSSSPPGLFSAHSPACPG